MFKKLLPTLAVAALSLLGPAPAALAQTGDLPRTCDFDNQQRQYFLAHPEAERAYYDLLRRADQLARTTTTEQLRVLPDVTVPVVVHILYTDPSSNITDRQINDALAVVNLDYSKQNADTTSIISQFRPLIANVGFQFRLAKLDPNGNCTTGITRHYTRESDFGTAAVTDVVYWDRTKYLNIWIVDDIASGAGGYTFGGAANCPANDGIVLRSSQFGPNTRCTANLCRRSLTHEIGHYFGLPHTWGPSNTPGLINNSTATNCGTDDGISDTPNTAGYSQGSTINGVTLGPCTTTYSPCADAGGRPILSNVQNFMDYADCEMMFTLGQRAVMRSVVAGCRAPLVSQANLVATGTNDGFVANPCAPIASFLATPSTVCVGTPVSLRDYSYNSAAAGGTVTYSWSFPGGTPATATGNNPTVTYTTPGVYTITETVANSIGNNVTTRVIKVEGPGAGELAPYVESFENVNFPLNYPEPSLRNWVVAGNLANGLPLIPQATGVINNRWQRQAQLAAADGSAYLIVRNLSTPVATVSTLYSPNIDLSTTPAGQPSTLAFSRVFKPRTAGGDEKLTVAFSSDCGNTWSTPITYNSTALTTAATNPGSASDWENLSVAIPSAYQRSPRFKVRFQFTNNTVAATNNFYFDNVRVSLVLGNHNAALQQRGISVQPNPYTNETAVSLELTARTEVQVSLTDMLGREVMALPAKAYSPGKQTIALNPSGHALSPGIYVVRISLEGKTYSSKLTVN
jgi:PKD repeat protein